MSDPTDKIAWRIIDARDETIGQMLPPAETPGTTKPSADRQESPAGVVADGEDLHDQEIELEILGTIIPRLRSRTFLDIGAERGALAGFFIKQGLSGHLFEPFAQHAATLGKLVAGTTSVFHPWAIDDHDHEGLLFLAKDPEGLPIPEFNSLQPLADDARIRQAGTQPVTCRALGSLVKARIIPENIGVVKTDTEGNDAAVLRGFAPLSCEALCCEFFTEGIYAGWENGHPRILVELARANGFDRYIVIEHRDGLTTVDVSPVAFGPKTWGNIIFVREHIWENCLPQWLALITRHKESIALQLAAQNKEITLLQQACEERLALLLQYEPMLKEKEAAIHSREDALGKVHAELNEFRTEAARLHAVATQKLTDWQQTAAESEKARHKNLMFQQVNASELALARRMAVEKEHEINRLKTELANNLGGWKDADAKLTEVFAENERVNKAADERLKLLDAATAEADRLRAELKRVNWGSIVGDYEALEQQARTNIRQLNDELLAKEAVIQKLKEACDEREVLIQQLSLQVPPTSRTAGTMFRVRLARFSTAARRKYGARFWDYFEQRARCRLGKLSQYEPVPMAAEKFPAGREIPRWPRICIITPSYQQGRFLERTMRSVLDQQYPNLAYGVQDGGSTDESVAIIVRHLDRLAHSESAADNGQADAIQRGFARLYPGPADIMAWLNSDDLLMPGALRYIGAYFASHPEVDVVYGHRVIIDENDREVGRWFMPRYHEDTLPWFDLVPQETLFWRASRFQEIGGMDPRFHFAMDWDLLLRFAQAGLNIRRLPYFIGCFRVHNAQKTSTRIETLGEEEMALLRRRTHGALPSHLAIHRHLEAEIQRSALVEWLHARGIRI